MARIHYVADGAVSTEQFIAALTDFSERRPELWPNLDAKYYELRIAVSARGRIIGLLVQLLGSRRFAADLRETLDRLARSPS